MWETFIVIIFGIIALLLALMLMLLIGAAVVEAFISIDEAIYEYKRERKKRK